MMSKQSGQVLLILLLVMAVGLGVGISVIQRSITDVSTATRIEESTRAFSAAEAGLEKALRGTCTEEPCVSFDNSATASIQGGGLLPAQPGQALEYPPISKEAIAQFWLALPDNPGTTTPSPAGSSYYTQSSLELYWGNSSTDKAAIEVTPIFWDGTRYTSVSGTNYKNFYDPDSIRADQNGFTFVSCASGNTTGLAGGSNFYCKQIVSGLPANLKLLRVRLLYNTTDQPIAIKPISTAPCNTSPLADGCSIPPQARVITSTGISGKTSRTVQLFTEEKVVPFFLDYAIFSAGDIEK